MKNPPQKAILLAAGFGSRMAPLSYDLPKPMMPLWGVPLIEHTVNAMQEFGVRDILINLHHHPQPILEWARQRQDRSPRLQFSFEPDIAGTGGALRKASHFIDDAPFWLVNTDIAFALDPSVIIADFHKHRPLATLWLHANLGPRTVEMCTNGNITNFASKAPGGSATYTFCGLQLLSPKILNYLPDAPFSTVVDGYRCALTAGEAVRGCSPDKTFWADLGTPERYLAAHREIALAQQHNAPGNGLMHTTEIKRMQRARSSTPKTEGFVSIGRGVRLPGTVSLCNTVVWDNATLTDGAILKNAIVGRNTTIRGKHSEDTTVPATTVPAETVMARALKQMRGSAADTTYSALAARGSDRSFTRLQNAHSSRILVRYDDTHRPENARYAALTRALTAAGIRVPRVVLDFPEHKATLFEDAGSQALLDRIPDLSRQARLTHYRRIIKQVLKLHALTTDALPPMEPAFSLKLYRWEHELFFKHFIGNRLNTDRCKALRKILNQCAERLVQQPPVPIHRDLQSSNILLRNGTPVLIDFQGMRLGAAAYDLASLLCDPYIMLKANDRNILLDAYCRQSPQGEAVCSSFIPTAIQRLAQALGAFGRLSAIPATTRFAQYIPPASEMLNTMLSQFIPDDPKIPLIPIEDSIKESRHDKTAHQNAQPNH